LLGQQVFNQRPVEWIPFQPTQKQLRIRFTTIA
jgi:hypothetical protein